MWENIQGVESAKVISTDLELPVSNYMMISDREIRDLITQQLMHEVNKAGVIEIEKISRPDPYQTTYRGVINVLPIHHNKAIVNRYKYRVHGMDFTHEQVKKALRNTFPEYWL